VVEGVDADIASEVTAAIRIPTIGIGASVDCDGQILVTDDMLGMFDWSPKFVRRYANLREVIGEAAASYAKDIRTGAFPGEAELYRLKRGK
jgi:3-methyl-2-oxobutanoate hydroxymethyltransferase